MKKEFNKNTTVDISIYDDFSALKLNKDHMLMTAKIMADKALDYEYQTNEGGVVVYDMSNGLLDFMDKHQEFLTLEGSSIPMFEELVKLDNGESVDNTDPETYLEEADDHVRRMFDIYNEILNYIPECEDANDPVTLVHFEYDEYGRKALAEYIKYIYLAHNLFYNQPKHDGFSNEEPMILEIILPKVVIKDLENELDYLDDEGKGVDFVTEEVVKKIFNTMIETEEYNCNIIIDEVYYLGDIREKFLEVEQDVEDGLFKFKFKSFLGMV